eukprot:g38877.t1
MDDHRFQLDAINLMIRDLETRHEEIRHAAAFKGCTSQLRDLQAELIGYLRAKKDLLGPFNAPKKPFTCILGLQPFAYG